MCTRKNGDSYQEGVLLENMFPELNLSQLICRPSHFRVHCTPSCIDLITRDQPNIVLKCHSGIRNVIINQNMCVSIDN